MFRDEYLIGDNFILFLNAVDGLTLGEDLVKIRSNRFIDRSINVPTKADMMFWVMFNFAFMNILIAGIGLMTALSRRAARNAYAALFAKKK